MWTGYHFISQQNAKKTRVIEIAQGYWLGVVQLWRLSGIVSSWVCCWAGWWEPWGSLLTLAELALSEAQHSTPDPNQWSPAKQKLCVTNVIKQNFGLRNWYKINSIGVVVKTTQGLVQSSVGVGLSEIIFWSPLLSQTQNFKWICPNSNWIGHIAQNYMYNAMYWIHIYFISVWYAQEFFSL